MLQKGQQTVQMLLQGAEHPADQFSSRRAAAATTPETKPKPQPVLGEMQGSEKYLDASLRRRSSRSADPKNTGGGKTGPLTQSMA